ncbi:DeoR family transcriptional regulator [Cypionkella aquatica]|uniref:DeoR family transcriptional regulator n=1 Tax=Cypionkella aquatica TaxID=1756042 RepID=A0AA37X3E2_9RHOB|nr:DeoR/GlpR family DNA-binding transcription regulator [Cypionkella aquatica]GLS88175.1 DeoR family transcriptional regulator [Cypionkella aquatica]
MTSETPAPPAPDSRTPDTRAKENRREEIAAYVLRQGEARIDDLVQHFGVSRMTIHRHIDQLAASGLLRKQHGGVTALPSGVYESLFRYRQTVATAEKSSLARAALRFVEPGQVVMLDDSSTSHAVAGLLPQLAPLTVITNSLASLQALTGMDEISLICLGGQFHPTYNAFIGHLCETALPALRANVLICSASAAQNGVAYIQDAQVTRTKQAMMASANRRILLLNHEKFGRSALHALAPLSTFDAVLTASTLPHAEIQALKAAGVRLHLIETDPK